jgi:hypothetical protein
MGTLRFTLRTDKIDKSEQCPLELIYQVSGQRKKVFIDNKINSVNWDATNQKAIYIPPAKAKKTFKTSVDLDKVILTEKEVKEINDHISEVTTDIGCFGDMLHPIPWQTDHLFCWQGNAAHALVA